MAAKLSSREIDKPCAALRCGDYNEGFAATPRVLSAEVARSVGLWPPFMVPVIGSSELQLGS